MLCPGQSSLSFLASQLDATDSGESSHWKKYHSNFRFLGDRFDGLNGFGGCSEPLRGPRGFVHRFLQRRFRAMGAAFPDFAPADAAAAAITARQNRAYDLDVLRQALSLAFLKARAPDHAFAPPSTVCVIGDGFASFTALVLATASADRVVLVNLTKTLLVDLWYLRLWMGESVFESSVDLVTDEAALARALAKPADRAAGGRVVAIRADDHELLRHCPVTVAINVASMQEMNVETIAAYFDDLRSSARHGPVVFYCCNREEKTLPDGTLTRFRDYPWRVADRVLIDELCPWHQQYYSVRPPFYRPYDGPIRHRLAILEGMQD
jgi:hypothetical protein